jgi:uncharacterized membrane protein
MSSVETTNPSRLLALDWLRGIVMVLMTVDHASDWLNRGRFMADGALFWKPGSALPAAQFVLRWMTHLCAPTFVFLAGVSIALSSRRRRAQGESEAAIDRALITRGLFIAALDPLWMSPVFMEGEGIVLQVMYAIGFSMIAMAGLRRLPARWLLGGALAFFAVSEVCVTAARAAGPNLPLSLLLTAGRFPLQWGPLHVFIVGYPVLHWLAIMALGHGSTDWLVRARTERKIEQRLWLAGVLSLALFAVVRAANAYGNMGLLRDDASFLQWLHVSKYPPSITYLTLELGLMALLLAWLVGRERSLSARALPTPRPLQVLSVFGQCALFYYVLHVHVVAALSLALGVAHQGGIGLTLGGAGITAFVLYFACVPYRRYKARNPDGWARFL